MALGDTCRTGCRTRDHMSWGECARGASLHVAWLASSNGGYSLRGEKLHTAELDGYRQARKDGIQPAATTAKAVREAYRVSELMSKPYNADVMPNTALVPDARTASAAKDAGLL